MNHEQKEDRPLIRVPVDGSFVEILGYRIDGFASFDAFLEYLKKYSELEKWADALEKRLRHLLTSETVRLFDEVEPKTGHYKRNIRRLDTYGVHYKILASERARLSDEWDELNGEQIHRQVMQASTTRFRKGTPPPPPARPTRTCEVDGKPAVFHRWAECDRDLLRLAAFVKPEHQDEILQRYKDDGVIPCACDLEVVRVVVALVEYEDGSVSKVEPERVKFTDRRPKE